MLYQINGKLLDFKLAHATHNSRRSSSGSIEGKDRGEAKKRDCFCIVRWLQIIFYSE